MRYIVLLFILLLAAIWLGLWIAEDAGYILISYHHWTIQTSLWIGLAILLVTFFIVYLLIRLVIRVSAMPEKWQRWRQMRHYKKARLLANTGLCQLAEGNFAQAEKTLTQAAHLTKYPLIDYLAAASAASAQEAYARRDEYLRLAAKSEKGADKAVSLTQAKLQMQSHQWEQALATLKRLHQLDPHHLHTLYCLADVLLKLQDWEALYKLLPTLSKQNVLKEEKCNELYENVFHYTIEQKAKQGADSLAPFWADLPRKWQHHLKLQQAYARALLQTHQDQFAVHFIEKALKHHWDSTLVQCYGEARGESPAKQLKTAEGWLKNHLHDAALLLCLGKLSMHEKFWGKAVEYLEKSIDASPSTDAYHALGQTYEALCQEQEALKCYRKGLQLTQTCLARP